MPSPIQFPEIPDAERAPLTERLVVLIESQARQRQAETVQQLRDEIAVRKGEKLPVSAGSCPSVDEAFALS